MTARHVLEYRHDGGWQTTYMEIKIGDLIGCLDFKQKWKYMVVVSKEEYSDGYSVQWVHDEYPCIYAEDRLMEWKKDFYEYLNQNP